MPSAWPSAAVLERQRLALHCWCPAFGLEYSQGRPCSTLPHLWVRQNPPGLSRSQEGPPRYGSSPTSLADGSSKLTSSRAGGWHTVCEQFPSPQALWTRSQRSRGRTAEYLTVETGHSRMDPIDQEPGAETCQTGELNELTRCGWDNKVVGWLGPWADMAE